MPNNRLTIVYKFTSMDDIEARAKSRELLEKINTHNLPDGVEIEIRLHEIQHARQPRNIPINIQNAKAQKNSKTEKPTLTAQKKYRGLYYRPSNHIIQVHKY